MTSSTNNVRRVRPDDAATLKAVRLEALLDTPSAFGKTHAEEAAYAESYWHDAARDRSTGSHASNFLAFAEGTEAVGIVGAFYERPDRPVVELVSMWVRSDQRGTSTATQLVDAVVEWAIETQADAIELWVTRGNDRAVAFYERRGFASTGEYAPLPSDPCKDEQRMRRDL